MVSKALMQSVIDLQENKKSYTTINRLMKDVAKARFAIKNNMSAQDCLQLAQQLGCISKNFIIEPIKEIKIEPQRKPVPVEVVENTEIVNERKHYTSLLVALHPVVVKLCKQFGYVNKNNEPQFKNFRIDYFANKIKKVAKADKAKMEEIQSLEWHMLQLNEKICQKLSNRYYQLNRYRLPGLTEDDFLQEAKMAVVNCIYAYNGSTRFVTYIHWAIENRLKDFVRLENPLSPASSDIVITSNKVLDRMNHTGESFDNAALALGIPFDEIINYRRYSAKVYSQMELKDDDIDFAEVAIDKRSVETYDPGMFEALNSCDLSEIEKKTFDAYLSNEKNYQERIAGEYKLTRQAVSAALQRAKHKVRTKYFAIQEAA